MPSLGLLKGSYFFMPASGRFWGGVTSFFLFVFLLSVVWPLSAAAAVSRPILTVLAPQGSLDAAVVADFEKRAGVFVKVEFYTHRIEAESRVRVNPRYWNVVLAPETALERLAGNKNLRILSDLKLENNADLALQKLIKINDEGRVFLPLMMNPLGLVWRSETVTAKGPATWDWLVNPDLNPQWRSRISVSSERRFQFLLSLKATESPTQGLDLQLSRPAFSWMSRLKKQLQTEGEETHRALLGGRVVAGVVWMSDYIRLKRSLPGLEFAPPASGTYVERFGAVIPIESTQEDLSLDFLSHLWNRRKELTTFAGLVPLDAKEVAGSPVKTWAPFENYLLLPPSVENELNRVMADF